MLINGKQIASEILSDLKKRVGNLKTKGITPNLYIILLSEDESSASYVKQKQLRGEELGIKITLQKVDPAITTEDLLKKIDILNKDNSVHGIVIQRPMPIRLDEEKVESAVTPEKDVDGFNQNSGFGVPVALAVLEILSKIKDMTNNKSKNLNEWLKNQKITVIGKGLTAGKPVIKALGKEGIEPSIISSKTENREEILKNSDIVITAVGKPRIIEKNDLKTGVILIGVGMHREMDGKFHGDYEEKEISEITSFYTPTPGGVGPLNVAMLLKNVVEAAENYE